MAGKIDGVVREQEKIKIRKPDMYRVVLHNDDYTTQEFVVRVLQTVFHKPAAEATKIMLDVHKKGRGIVGVYTFDIASTKIALVRKMAELEEFPLRCTMEKA
ncbi:MAG: ATP-dependent Clp protease adapter ClpS [Spirochaetales bacterium]|nr:ATP-dependent Clp protease adapter ClpS [Spirochaetales bacterium]